MTIKKFFKDNWQELLLVAGIAGTFVAGIEFGRFITANSKSTQDALIKIYADGVNDGTRALNNKLADMVNAGLVTGLTANGECIEELQKLYIVAMDDLHL